MRRLAKLIGAILVAGLLGAAVSCGGARPSVEDQASGSDPAELSVQQLETFPDFPLYGVPTTFDGPALKTARRISPATLAELAGGVPPVETIGTPANRAEDRGHKVVSDFVTLIYGDCVANGDGGCPAPLEIQIWRSCNRYLDDYELFPGTPYPHVETTIRGTKAADFDEHLDVYAGSVTIVIFGERALAMRVAEALTPLNERARAEMPAGDDGPLPPSTPGPDCA